MGFRWTSITTKLHFKQSSISVAEFLSVTTATSCCVMGQVRDCGRHSQSSPPRCPLMIICHTHHKHFPLLPHAQHSLSHTWYMTSCDVSARPRLQIWRWRARWRRGTGRLTICQWRPPWRRRSREQRASSAGDGNCSVLCRGVLVCSSQRVVWERQSMHVFLFFFISQGAICLRWHVLRAPKSRRSRPSWRQLQKLFSKERSHLKVKL